MSHVYTTGALQFASLLRARLLEYGSMPCYGGSDCYPKGIGSRKEWNEILVVYSLFRTAQPYCNQIFVGCDQRDVEMLFGQALGEEL